MESHPVFCVKLCDSVEFTAPPISAPLLKSASDERTFFIRLPSDQQIETVAHLKSYIEELFRISSSTSLQGYNGNAFENAKSVHSLNLILHRRILVHAATMADSTPKRSKSIEATAASKVHRVISDKELCNQHGVTSQVKIVLNRDEIQVPSCQPVRITPTVIDLSSVDPHNTFKAKRWWPSSIKYYSLQSELRRKKKLSKLQICPFRCCDFVFTTRGHSTFKNHLGAAHGQKPFLCSMCNKKFRYSFSLRMHLKTHETRKYICKFKNCDYKSHHAFLLKRHMKCHSAVKEFCCRVCSYQSNRKANFEGHCDRMHGFTNSE